MPYNKVYQSQIKLEVLNMIAKQVEKTIRHVFFV
jgi:hypothetical protein